MQLRFVLLLLLMAAPFFSNAQSAGKGIITGADQVKAYLPYLKGKRVGMVVNQTSIIGNKLSVDSLRTLGVNIKAIFGPEHGFRGNASNGAVVANEVDPATGIPIISLYGQKRKPARKDLDKLDIMVFDIADVGCRFYTNINTLRDVMESCAEFGKELLILDRPNPNGYVDGPVLDMKLKSGIGQFPIPITHGMTIGEFARMLNGEGWLANKMQCKIKVIPVANYRHDMDYTMPVEPSPNLNTQQSILLYPSICMFEGTIVSQGRGTYMPFTVLGAPRLKGIFDFTFTPVSIPGKSERPVHENEMCYGLDLRKFDVTPFRKAGKINLGWIIDLYKAYPDKAKFFHRGYDRMGDFDNLAGTVSLREQIIAGKSEEDIRKGWEPGLSAYKKMRLKYVLYK